MNEIERLQFQAVMKERDNADRECERLRQQLAAAEALTAEAAAAGPIVDEQIRELEAKLAVATAQVNMLTTRFAERTSECDRLRQALEAESRSRQYAEGTVQALMANQPDPQPAETELERRAWELFASAMATEHSDITPEQSFLTARMWMALRDQQRKAGVA